MTPATGDVGWRGGLYNVLYYVMLIRDDGGFEEGNEWMHVLGVSQPTWAVILSAIQRAIRAECNNPTFRVSYDSASPFHTGGRYHRAVQYPKFGKAMDSWVMSAVPAMENPYYAEHGEYYHFPFQSPVGDLTTMNHINVKGGFEQTTRDIVSDALLINHNAWVYVRAFLEANEMTFSHATDAQHMVPKSILNVVDFIGDLLATGKRGWKKKLDGNKELLESVFPKWGEKKRVGVIVEDVR